MAHPIKSPRKLIEVALPLDAINQAAKEEKAVPRHGHPQTLHYWWARRPLAAARAVIFAQLVNDPGYQQGGGFKYGKNKREAAIERKRLFKIIEELVLWKNTNNDEVLDRARAEILRSWREVCLLNKDHPQAADLFNPERLPTLHDPFSGGGTIPLEAQRLGLQVYASDLNPVAVLISKALVEILPKFAGHAPVGPVSAGERNSSLNLQKMWPAGTGLAEDVRRYGTWILDQARKQLSHLYPPVEITAQIVHDRPDLKPLLGTKLTPIAWLWARTVRSPNPAFSHVEVPLTTTFVLSTRAGEAVYIDPIVKGDRYRLKVKVGTPYAEADEGTKAKGQGANFRCLVSNTPISGDYIKTEAQAGRMGARLMAVLAESSQGRVYLEATPDQEEAASKAAPKWMPDVEFFQQALGFRVGNYGMSKWSDLFTARQLVALGTLKDLIETARTMIQSAALEAFFGHESCGLEAGCTGAKAYAEAVSVYLACALSRLVSYNNTICLWNMKGGSVAQIFARQTVSMSWDYIEINPLQKMSGNWNGAVEWVSEVVEKLPTGPLGRATQLDATSLPRLASNLIFSTDPPYYDNIGYADLSDFFYVWLRPCLKPIFPELFATLAVPKAEELVATPHRHGGKKSAEAFFLEGMTRAMQRLSEQAHPAFPVTIYYAFKQSERDSDSGIASTGWETFLDAVFHAGFTIDGTWPMRTEREGGVRNASRNSLASSIVLVCLKRPIDAPTVSRRHFLRELNSVLPEALDEMTKGAGDERSPVAPVDLSQAIIGPGMAVFSKYAAVLEADGTPMKVKTALQIINRFLAEDDFDSDTQFCLHWFEQYGWKDGKFGDADTLARAKGTSVEGVKQAGVLYATGGVVRLVKWPDYPAAWDPERAVRLPAWEALHHIIRVFKSEGESGAGAVLAVVQAKAEAIRQLAYRLYTLCERAGWTEDARAYNEIITSWSAVESAAARVPGAKQAALFEV